MKNILWYELAFIAVLTAAVGFGVHFWDQHHLSPPALPDPLITVPNQIEAKSGRNAQIVLDKVVGGPVEWDTHFADCDAFAIPGHSLVVLYPNAGTYKVTARTASGSKIASGTCTVKVVGPTPPVPPVPPTPPTPPTPPEPPAPIPEAGLRMLIVLETTDLSKLPPSQVDTINSFAVRDYLNKTCPKVGNQPEYRILDKDVDLTNESKLWQDAFAKAKGKPIPWVIISNGKTGFEGPLPKTVDELLTLLKKYGGG